MKLSFRNIFLLKSSIENLIEDISEITKDKKISVDEIQLILFVHIFPLLTTLGIKGLDEVELDIPSKIPTAKLEEIKLGISKLEKELDKIGNIFE